MSEICTKDTFSHAQDEQTGVQKVCDEREIKANRREIGAGSLV